MEFFDNKYIKAVLPAICAFITGLCGNAVFSVSSTFWKSTCIILLVIFGIFDILLIIRYTKVEQGWLEKIINLEYEGNEKDKKIEILTKHEKGFKDTFNRLERCFDDNANKIYNLVKNARTKGVIDFNIWSYKNICDLEKDDRYFLYQKVVNNPVKSVPSHEVIVNNITQFKEDYRYETEPNPITALRNRKEDNVEVGVKPMNLNNTGFEKKKKEN